MDLLQTTAYQDAMDPTKSIHHRPDYKRGMSYISDVESYHAFMGDYFRSDVDIDRILVFATISRDVLKKMSHLNVIYLAWLIGLQQHISEADFAFLSSLWSECKFI